MALIGKAEPFRKESGKPHQVSLLANIGGLEGYGPTICDGLLLKK